VKTAGVDIRLTVGKCAGETKRRRRRRGRSAV